MKGNMDVTDRVTDRIPLFTTTTTITTTTTKEHFVQPTTTPCGKVPKGDVINTFLSLQSTLPSKTNISGTKVRDVSVRSTKNLQST